MLVPYNCCTKQFEDYYISQTGNGLPYYAGQSFQKGYGIGGWFKRLFRTALPFLKSGAKSVGKEVLKTSTQIANDMLEGRVFQSLLDKGLMKLEKVNKKSYPKS
ncbi:uncharacterized protein F54H12.2 [Trichonephila clavipes]|nr:uncharacterized protein F54H12.2 [Trichonephila clavipes]